MWRWNHYFRVRLNPTTTLNNKYLIPPDEFHEALPVVDGADLAAEDPVQDLADGEGEGAGQQHEQLRQPDRVGAHGQPVPRADRLGDDLAEDDDTHSGACH